MFEPNNSGALYYGKGPAPSGDAYMEAMERQSRRSGAAKRLHPLDTAQAMANHAILMGHYLREIERQGPNRVDMAMDEDFFDHIQWTEDEIAALAARGQAPLVFNLIQTSVNWVLGSQRRMTMDYKILPRRAEALKASESKSELLRHLRDINRSEYAYSAAFADAVKAGLGWIETGQANPEQGAIVFDRRESWRNMLWDSTATEYDLNDARYISRTKWLDLDTGMALWPTRKGLLEMSASDVITGSYNTDNGGDEPMDSTEVEHFNGTTASQDRYSADRPRVRVIEMWFKRTVPRAKLIRGGQFSGELFDEWSPGHHREIIDGKATLVERPREVIHVALMTDAGLLDLRESPYRHNKYPFTPVWGYRRARDGMPYGMVRGMRDINRDLNKRASKALHHLSAVRVTVQKGAVDDLEVLRDEAGRPDSVIEYNQGFAPPAVETDHDLAAAHIDLMGRDAQMIQSVAGVTDENMGRKSNATSGKAIVARQDQGQLATSMFFDNLRQSRVIHGEKLTINVEQFYTDEDEFRITNQRGNPEFRKINSGGPETAIALFKSDFVITEEDWRATVRQAQAEQLLELMSQLAGTAPQIVMATLDLVIEAMDVPKRDELVKRIRQITGVSDPDADPNNPDPETVALNEQKAKQAALEERGIEAELSFKEGQARKLMADAARSESGLATDTLSQLKAALEAAIAIAGAPAVANAADSILAHARAEAMGGPAQPMPAVPAMPMQQQPAPMGAQPAMEGIPA